MAMHLWLALAKYFSTAIAVIDNTSQNSFSSIVFYGGKQRGNRRLCCCSLCFYNLFFSVLLLYKCIYITFYKGICIPHYYLNNLYMNACMLIAPFKVKNTSNPARELWGLVCSGWVYRCFKSSPTANLKTVCSTSLLPTTVAYHWIPAKKLRRILPILFHDKEDRDILQLWGCSLVKIILVQRLSSSGCSKGWIPTKWKSKTS